MLFRSVIIKNGKGETLQTVECPVDICAIGKSRSNLIQLRGWKVAPQHAEIHRTSEGLFVERVAQKAPLEVNGNTVDHYGPLRTADQIYIAGYYLQVGEFKKKAAGETVAQAPAQKTPARPLADEDDDEEDLRTVIGVPRHAVLEDRKSVV